MLWRPCGSIMHWRPMHNAYCNIVWILVPTMWIETVKREREREASCAFDWQKLISIQQSTINGLPIAERPQPTLNGFLALFLILTFFVRAPLSLKVQDEPSITRCSRFITLDWFYDQPPFGSLRHPSHCFCLSLYFSFICSWVRSLFLSTSLPPSLSRLQADCFYFVYPLLDCLEKIKHVHTHTNTRGAAFCSSTFLLLCFSWSSLRARCSLRCADSGALGSAPLVVDRCRFEWKFRELARAFVEKGRKHKSAYQ